MISLETDLLVIGGGIVGLGVADFAASRGLRVVVVEAGPPDLAKEQPAQPKVVCAKRPHEGCELARHQVLGGNGHYWGGGLMRTPDTTLHGILGVRQYPGNTGGGPDLASHFVRVEQAVGLKIPPAREAPEIERLSEMGLQAAEICVLPGKRRNVAATFLASLTQNPRCTVLSPATVADLEVWGRVSEKIRVQSVEVSFAGDQITVLPQNVVIAAGVIDSNVLVQRFASRLLSDDMLGRLGRGMHEHLSVPIADIGKKSGRSIRNFVAPRFRGRTIVGRHYELPLLNDTHSGGFLHFTFSFDEASPYREIKELMLLRQQQAGMASLLRAGLRVAGYLPELTRLGVERVVRRRLYVGDDVTVTVTLDFESSVSEQNMLTLDGDQVLFDWDIRPGDEASFLALLPTCDRFLKVLEEDFGARLHRLFDLKDEKAAVAHLHLRARDCYHLGGGLCAGEHGAPVGTDLRLAGSENVWIVSTAVYARPGVVNPTHGLLALADWLTATLAKEASSGRHR